MVDPVRAGQKFNEGWIASKQSAIAAYTAGANTYAAKAIAKRAEALAALTLAFAAGGSWETGLQKYVGNDLLGNAYTESLNNITTLAPYQIDKVVESVKVKQHFASVEDAVLQIFKDQTTSGLCTVPPNVTDIGLLPMLTGGMNAFESTLSTNSNAALIYSTIQAYMNTDYGWPNVP